jgi:hypothetical protein
MFQSTSFIADLLEKAASIVSDRRHGSQLADDAEVLRMRIGHRRAASPAQLNHSVIVRECDARHRLFSVLGNATRVLHTSAHFDHAKTVIRIAPPTRRDKSSS